MTTKREGTLDSMQVENIAAKLGHTRVDVHANHEVALTVARVAEAMGYEGAGCANVGDWSGFWVVTYDVEATMAKSTKPPGRSPDTRSRPSWPATPGVPSPRPPGC